MDTSAFFFGEDEAEMGIFDYIPGFKWLSYLSLIPFLILLCCCFKCFRSLCKKEGCTLVIKDCVCGPVCNRITYDSAMNPNEENSIEMTTRSNQRFQPRPSVSFEEDVYRSLSSPSSIVEQPTRGQSNSRAITWINQEKNQKPAGSLGVSRSELSSGSLSSASRSEKQSLNANIGNNGRSYELVTRPPFESNLSSKKDIVGSLKSFISRRKKKERKSSPGLSYPPQADFPSCVKDELRTKPILSPKEKIDTKLTQHCSITSLDSSFSPQTQRNPRKSKGACSGIEREPHSEHKEYSNQMYHVRSPSRSTITSPQPISKGICYLGSPCSSYRASSSLVGSITSIGMLYSPITTRHKELFDDDSSCYIDKYDTTCVESNISKISDNSPPKTESKDSPSPNSTFLQRKEFFKQNERSFKTHFVFSPEARKKFPNNHDHLPRYPSGTSLSSFAPISPRRSPPPRPNSRDNINSNLKNQSPSNIIDISKDQRKMKNIKRSVSFPKFKNFDDADQSHIPSSLSGAISPRRELFSPKRPPPPIRKQEEKSEPFHYSSEGISLQKGQHSIQKSQKKLGKEQKNLPISSSDGASPPREPLSPEFLPFLQIQCSERKKTELKSPSSFSGNFSFHAIYSGMTGSISLPKMLNKEERDQKQRIMPKINFIPASTSSQISHKSNSSLAKTSIAERQKFNRTSLSSPTKLPCKIELKPIKESCLVVRRKLFKDSGGQLSPSSPSSCIHSQGSPGPQLNTLSCVSEESHSSSDSITRIPRLTSRNEDDCGIKSSKYKMVNLKKSVSKSQAGKQAQVKPVLEIIDASSSKMQSENPLDEH